MKLISYVIVAATVSGCATIAAAQQSAAQSSGIALAPSHLRPYLEAARRADALEGAELRCLSFPDLPGNRWPAGLAKSWCAERRLITLDDVIAHLDRGDLAGLDASYKLHLERHFSKTDFSELIHNDMMYFGYDKRAGDVSARWLKAAPDSAYANAGRGLHLLVKAWEARGEDYVSKTPEENMRKMHVLMDQARESMGKALRIEPRLLPMHAKLIEVAMATGQDQLSKEVRQRAADLDPGCRYVTQSMMWAMRPKWGGSYSDMAQYAGLLKPQLARRPQVANTIVIPQVERARELFDAQQYQQVVDLLKPAALEANDPAMYSMLARAMGRLPKNDPWEGLVYLLQAARFVDDNLEAERELTRVLVNVGEMEWAIRFGTRALKLAPKDPWSSLYTGIAYIYRQQYAQSEAPLLVALEHEDTRAGALERLADAMNRGNQLDKAERYAEMLTREQPDNGIGWYALGWARARLGKEDAALPAFEAYLRLADRADPQQALLITQVESGVAKYRKQRADADASDRKQR